MNRYLSGARSPGSSWLIVSAAILLALVLGLAVPILPNKLTLVLGILVIGIIGIVIAIKLPERATAPYRLIYAIFLTAIAAKFLWPNFAYIPVPALPSKNPQRWVWALCIMYWAYSLLINRELRERLGKRLTGSNLSKMLLALVGWRLASIGFSEQPLASSYTMFVELFDYLPAYLIALTWVRDVNDAKRVAKCLLVTAVIVGFITVVELVMKKNLFVAFAPHDITNEEFLIAAVESKLRGGVYRAQASFNHPLLLAQFAVAILPLAMSAVLQSKSMLGRVFSVSALTLLAFCLVASRTRTAIVVAGLVVALALLLKSWNAVTSRSRGFRTPLLGGISLVGGIAVLGGVVAVVLVLTAGRDAEEASSSMARLLMLNRAIGAAMEQPLFGFGPGIGNLHAAVYNSRGTSSLDSYWLTQMLESGIPAMLIFIALLCNAAIEFIKEMFTARASEHGFVAATWSLSIIAFGISTVILSTPHNMPLLYLAMGIVVAMRMPDNKAQAEHRETGILGGRISR